MTEMELDYLNAMEQGFLGKAVDTREALKALQFDGQRARAEQFADCMEICAELVKQIREDFEKFEALAAQKQSINKAVSKASKWDEGGNV